MNHYLVYGNRIGGYSDRYEIWANDADDAIGQVIAFGYDSAEAFDWDRMMRIDLQLFGR